MNSDVTVPSPKCSQRGHRMSRFELFLWNVLVGKDKSIPVFTTRRGNFFTLLQIRSREERAALGFDTRWKWYKHLISSTIRSHKHDVERASKRSFEIETWQIPRG